MRISSDGALEMPIFTALSVPRLLSIMSLITEAELDSLRQHYRQHLWMTCLDDSRVSRAVIEQVAVRLPCVYVRVPFRGDVSQRQQPMPKASQVCSTRLCRVGKDANPESIGCWQECSE